MSGENEFEFICPGCSTRLRGSRELAGQTVPCPLCETRMIVPSPTVPQSPAPSQYQQSQIQQSSTPASEVWAALSQQQRVPHVSWQSSSTPAGQTADAVQQTRESHGAIDQVFDGMGQALSVRKLTFFLLGIVAAIIVCGLLVLIGISASVEIGIGMVFLAVLVAIGLSGVVAGGVAHLTVQEGQGRTCGFLDALTFCSQQFVALFFGTILLTVAVAFVWGLVNGLIAVANLNRTAGSALGSVLFVPQVVVNAGLIVLCLAGVLVPCAVAVERIGPIRAVERLLSLLVKRPGALLLQLAITICAAVMMLCVLASLTFLALGPTFVTNGPSRGGITSSLRSLGAGDEDLYTLLSDEEAEDLGFPGLGGRRSSGRQSSRQHSESPAPRGAYGDRVRVFGLGIVFAAVLAFPVVFWICAFTRYYESLVPSFSAWRPGPTAAIRGRTAWSARRTEMQRW